MQDPTHFCERLEALTELRGKAVVSDWIAKVHAGETPWVVQELLTKHYDPMYAQSIERNFKQYAQALPLELPDRTPASFAGVASTLISRVAAAPVN